MLKSDDTVYSSWRMGSMEISHTDGVYLHSVHSKHVPCRITRVMLPHRVWLQAFKLAEGSQCLYNVVITVVVCMLSRCLTGSI